MNAPVLKTGMGASPSWVRIPPSPPYPSKSHKRITTLENLSRSDFIEFRVDGGVWVAQTTLMKQGLEAILVPPENQLKNEADYGRWILKVAWTVEILAALTGLFLSYRVYPQETTRLSIPKICIYTFVSQ